MTPVSAASGTASMSGLNLQMKIMRQREAEMPLRRPRPPLFMFTIVCPMRAHPASDPNSAHTTFATPCS
eukprot:9498881-Pyramimonas_sp.AAC.1